MDNNITLLSEDLASSFDDIKIVFTDQRMIIMNCRKDSVISLLSYLKNLGYDHLALISCVDRIKENAFELIYILSAYTEDVVKGGINLIVKTELIRDKAEMDTVISVFENAEPYERELHELFGVYFKGHPRLTRLLLDREYPVPPFRKDFDTRKYVRDIFDNVPSVEVKKLKNERT